MLGIKPFDLIDAGAGVLGEVVNVDLAVGPNDRHANRCVPQTVDGAIGVGDRIVLEPVRSHQRLNWRWMMRAAVMFG